MDHNDIYITNVSMFTTFGSERIRHIEEKTSFDLKNELSRQFEEQGDDWGEITKCYFTKSQGENDGTYMAFMSMKDSRTHSKIVELYNKTMFRGRELIKDQQHKIKLHEPKIKNRGSRDSRKNL